MSNPTIKLSKIFAGFIVVFFATFLEFLFFCLILKILHINRCFKYNEFFIFFQSINFILLSFLLIYRRFVNIKTKITDFIISLSDLWNGIKYFFYLLITIAIFSGIFYIVVNSILKIPLDAEIRSVDIDAFYSPFRFFIYFISFCFIGPFAEELFFRKILYVSLRDRFSFFCSMILSAFFFGIGHINNPVYAFIVGLYLAYIYEKKHNLFINTIVHSLMNSLSLFVQFSFSYFK